VQFGVNQANISICLKIIKSQIINIFIIMNIVLFQLLATIILCDLPWIKPEELNRGLPSSISIYTLKTDTSPYSSKLTGAYARFNMNDPNLEFVVKDTNGDALGYFPKTPMEYANAGKYK
jgi:hypothetical protein